jgi:amino acid adenylation domain-containing protein/non-ribosomal peptide synthase protein (TIGR01720 family)
MALEYRVAPFDLNMLMAESGEDILATLEYNTDLFDGATIERYLNHFQILLDGIVSTPDVPISVLPILSELELREGLLAVPDQAVDIPESECLHRLFEGQVQQAPDAIAVVLGAAQITYSELNHRSNQLARYLRRLGVGPEVLVGLWMERSIEKLIGIMGILKAGGAYLPMDLAYPAERVSFMLEDSQAPVVLTHQGLVENLPATTAQVICIDSDWELISQEPGGDLDIKVMPSNLIYVIYTSGSTGKPKGVQVTHKNVDRLFKSTQSWYNFNGYDVWTLFHSYAFDFSVWEIWGALLYGGKVVVVPYELSRFPEAFYELLVQERVTVLNQTPSAFRQLIQAEEELGSSNDLSLRLVIFGGEALELQSLRPWFDRHGDTVPQLVNMYGITETTVHVTYRPITISDVEAGQGSMIGVPVPDLRVYVLDRHLQPVPIGVSGELYVGGGGVSRGYLNSPEISSDRFIPDPFSQESGARLYRTGDLGRYLNYGDIEYLGRIDYQVQVRGFRVELGEIDSVLTGHPQVEESVVISREDPSGHERLVAYVVPTREGAPAVSTLREFLKTKLPDYMIPSVFMVLDKLPLTPHGKVDRKALPEPDQTKLELESIFVAPRTFEEQNLAKIWSEVLNLKKIGIYDNFFELGGDSILGIQVIGRANQSGLKLTPRHLFEYQTIADLAAAAGTGKTVTAEQGVVEGEVLLTPIQHWFFEQELPDSHHWNQAVLLEVRKPLNPDLLKSSVDFLIKHHDALRLRFRSEESEWKQLNAGVEDDIPFTKIDLSKLSVEEQLATVESKTAELQAALNLESGPLLQIVYFDLGEQQADRLFVVIHHLAIDGVSWRILLEDLQVIYRQQTQEKSVQLPPKSTSYQYWARKLVDYAQSDDVLRELDYWLKVSRGNQINIPLDFPDGHNIGATAKNITTYLSAEETHAMLHDVPTAYRTEINDVLLTALVHTFTRWMNSTELLIDLEGHGREDIFDEVDLSRTVGWFTTVYPVCLYLKDGDNLGNSLKSIKEQLRSIPRRGVGYGLLRYLNKDKKVKTKLHSEPPAEICFNYLGQFDQVISENSVFNLAKESIGPLYSPKAKRRYLIEINSSIAESQLQLTWTYSDTLHKPDTIQVLAQNFIDILRSLISHCQSPDAGGYTASDFSDFGWDEKQLNNIVDRIKKTNK